MFDRESEFESLLAKTNEVRNQPGDLNEFVDGLAKVIGIKTKAILEGYHGDIMSLSEELRNKLFQAVKEGFEKSITEVQTKKEVEL